MEKSKKSTFLDLGPPNCSIFHPLSESELGFDQIPSKMGQKTSFLIQKNFKKMFFSTFSKIVGDRLGMNFHQKSVQKSFKNEVLRVFLVLPPGAPGGWGRENMDGGSPPIGGPPAPS